MDHLPKEQSERETLIRKCAAVHDLSSDLNLVARTPEEFLLDVTPLHLELVEDGIILADDGFWTRHSSHLKKIMKRAGLTRHFYPDGSTQWEWPNAVPQGRWWIGWEGFSDGHKRVSILS